MTSLSDVAELASVSTATASRVLSGSAHPVAERTRQRVLAAARTLDFEPNLLASGLARRRTQIVAVIVHDVMDEYFSEIARGVEDVAYERGYATLICNTDRDSDKEILYLRKLRAMQVDAIVFTAGSVTSRHYREESERQLRQVRAAGGAVVRLAPNPWGPPDVGYSNRVGMALAVDHLAGLGHTRIGYLGGPAGISTSKDRLAAIRLAMRDRGLRLRDEWIFASDFTRTGGERCAAEFVAAGLPTTAFVAANDQAAIGFLRRLRQHSVRVPDDVSIVGYDDIQPCQLVDPPLTTVHVPLYDLGRRGMEHALHLLDTGERVAPERLDLSLAVRASTSAVRATSTTTSRR